MLKIKAYSKINLGLEVLSKRKDGYHNINTVFTRTCLADEITLEPSKTLSVQCIPPLEISQEQNLVYKIIKLLQKSYDCKSKGVKITIYKKIPDKGGLGGGSSDAAVSLLNLIKLWHLDVDFTNIFDISLKTGSDIPYFLKQKTAIAKGRGEILDYFDYKIPYHILFVFPEIKISTPQAYSLLNRNVNEKTGKDFKSIILKSLESPEILREELVNDFENVVFAMYPELSKIKEKMYNYGAILSLMSGSGSTIFGFYDDVEKLNFARNILSNYQTEICINKDL